MNADEYILQLCHLGLNSRELLPENSGIYYVLDEKLIIWYVGQAKNLRNRWARKSHHRFYQLQKERKKLFTIYYELVAQSQLDAMERQRIEQYNPQLNGTKVKNKKLRPTETLLRETLVSIAPYSFVLGVESPRQEDLKFIEDCVSWWDEWRVKKAVLPLTVIHICINLEELQESFKDWSSEIRFLKKVFRQRTNHPNNWVCKGSKRDEKNEKLGVLFSPLKRTWTISQGFEPLVGFGTPRMVFYCSNLYRMQSVNFKRLFSQDFEVLLQVLSISLPLPKTLLIAFQSAP